MNPTAESTITEPTPAFDDNSIAPLLGSLLVEAGLITDEQFAYVLRIQRKLPSATNVLEIMDQMRIATPKEVRGALKNRKILAPIGSLLFELGYVKHPDIKVALQMQKEKPGRSIGAILVDNYVLTQGQLFDVLALQLGVERVNPVHADIPTNLLKKQSSWYRSRDLIPIGRRESKVIVAFASPENPESLAVGKREFGSDLIVGIASKEEIEEAIDLMDAGKKKAPVVLGDNVTVETVVMILRAAALAGVSDVHVEPRRDRLQIRFRQDGVLTDFKSLPLEMSVPLTSRLKVLGKADIAQKRLHQDGRMLYEDKEIAVQLRLSSYVSVYGETIVLRLLNAHAEMLEIDKLGLGPRMLQGFIEGALDAPSWRIDRDRTDGFRKDDHALFGH